MMRLSRYIKESFKWEKVQNERKDRLQGYVGQGRRERANEGTIFTYLNTRTSGNNRLSTDSGLQSRRKRIGRSVCVGGLGAESEGRNVHSGYLSVDSKLFHT